MDKKRFFEERDIDQLIEEYDPQYLMFISGRNDGKSYATKYRALKRAIRERELFTYLRRYEVDLKRVDPAQYWADFLGFDNIVENLSGGRWNDVGVEKGKFILQKIEEGKKPEKGPVIGYIHALSVARSYKSNMFPDVGSVLYEEFVTDGGYLYNEPAKLMNYVSTIFRGRTGRVFLVGNMITRISPYYKEWQLRGIEKMKPGQVDIYDEEMQADHFDGALDEDQSARVLVHIPDVIGKGSGKKSMFFGKAAGMIAGKKWDSHSQPHLKYDRRMYRELYHIVFDSDANARFLMTLLQDSRHPDSVLWYVEPKTSPALPRTRLVGPQLVEGAYWSKDFVPLVPQEVPAFRILRLGRIAYSDDLTGTEFKRAMRQVRIPETGTD